MGAGVKERFGTERFEGLFDAEEELAAYDPLEYVEGEDDEDWADDDGLLLPEPTPPEHAAPKRRALVFTPEAAGGIREAVRDLVTTNTARRPILLALIDAAREGADASELFALVENLERDNRSVYEPVSYLHMLERAGAIEQMGAPDAAAGGEDDDLGSAIEGFDSGGVTYLSITEDFEPRWIATAEGLAAYDELTRGTECREKLFGPDARYAEVYATVMGMLEEGGKSKDELGAAAEAFEVTKHPRKLGNYFVDVLESTQAIAWGSGAWHLTNVGTQVLAELRQRLDEREVAVAV